MTPMEKSEQQFDNRKNTIIHTALFFIDNNKMFNFLHAEGFCCEYISVRFSDEFGTGIKTYYRPPMPALMNLFNKNFLNIIDIAFIRIFTKEKIRVFQDKVIFVNVFVEIIKEFRDSIILRKKN